MIASVKVRSVNTRHLLTFTVGDDTPRRELIKVLPGIYDEMVLYWHRRMCPEHFETVARSRYAYAPRTSRYRRRKMRQKGHDIDLVFSGNLRREVTSSIRARSTRKGGRGHLRGPRYLWQFRTVYGASDKADEITRMSQDEAMEIARRLNGRVLDHLVERSVQEERIA